MAVTENDAAGEDAPKSRLSLVIGLVLASVLGAAGFFLAYNGLLPIGGGADDTGTETAGPSAGQDAGPAEVALTFVELPPMVVSLGSPGESRHLRFQAELEVAPAGRQQVVALMPRILDALNGYLRAVPSEEFEAPAALVKLRAQMLRRIQLVVGGGQVRDLLITEFVIN